LEYKSYSFRHLFSYSFFSDALSRKLVQDQIADVLSNAIYNASTGNDEARELAIEVISTGIVDLKSTFYNLYAPNGQATLKFYATLKGEYGVVEAIERQEHNLHNLEVEVSGDAFDIV
jgi:hypothetical protein